MGLRLLQFLYLFFQILDPYHEPVVTFRTGRSVTGDTLIENRGSQEYPMAFLEIMDSGHQ